MAVRPKETKSKKVIHFDKIIAAFTERNLKRRKLIFQKLRDYG